MQTNAEALNSQAISASTNEDDTFIFTASKSLKTTYQVAEIAALSQQKDVYFRLLQITQGTHAAEIK